MSNSTIKAARSTAKTKAKPIMLEFIVTADGQEIRVKAESVDIEDGALYLLIGEENITIWAAGAWTRVRAVYPEP